MSYCPYPECSCNRPLLKEALDALEWTGGSPDFAPGGKARKGWLKTVAPILEKHGRRIVKKRKVSPK